MTEFFKFAGESPFTTFVLALIAGQVVWGLIVILPNRVLRHWNIRKHGYPPVHCDADGDFKEEKDE